MLGENEMNQTKYANEGMCMTQAQMDTEDVEYHRRQREKMMNAAAIAQPVPASTAEIALTRLRQANTNSCELLSFAQEKLLPLLNPAGYTNACQTPNKVSDKVGAPYFRDVLDEADQITEKLQQLYDLIRNVDV